MPTFVDEEAAKDFECAICMEVFTDPIQIGSCSHVFCKGCIDQFDDHFPCPTCRTMSIRYQSVRVPFIDRQIKNLQVLCPNHRVTAEKEAYFKEAQRSSRRRSSRLRNKQKHREEDDDRKENENSNSNSRGSKRKRRRENRGTDCWPKKRSKPTERATCRWVGAQSDLEGHSLKCPLQLISCEHCGDRMIRFEVDSHAEICPEFPVQCTLCHTVTTRASLDQHLDDDCPHTEVECECGEMVKRCDVKEHDQRDCPEVQIPCAFKFIGSRCRLHSVRRKEMAQHMVDPNMISEHLLTVLEMNSRLKQENDGLRAELSETKQWIKDLVDDQKRRMLAIEQSLNKRIHENAVIHRNLIHHNAAGINKNKNNALRICEYVQTFIPRLGNLNLFN